MEKPKSGVIVNHKKAYKCLAALVGTNADRTILHWYCIMINMAMDGEKRQFEIARTEFMARYISGPEAYIPESFPDVVITEGQIRVEVRLDEFSEPHM